MEKKKKFIKTGCIAVVLLIGIALIMAEVNKDWFMETVPYNGYGESSVLRREEDVIEETFAMTGGKRYREGDFVENSGVAYYPHEGVSIDISMDVKVKKGFFKMAIYDLGEDVAILEEGPRPYLSEDKKVYEEEFAETGEYRINPVLQPDRLYLVVELTPLGDGVAYSYNASYSHNLKRWQLLYDRYIGSLPFCHPKYDSVGR